MKFLPLAVILGLGFTAVRASAQTVLWGTAYSELPAVQMSNGTADTSGLLTWTLGYFNSGFTPDANNVQSWVGNYHQVAAQQYHTDSGTGEWVASQAYASGDPADPPEVPTARDKIMWIFAYNNTGMLGNQGGEAILFTQNTTFPSDVAKNFDIQDTAGSAEDDDFHIVWGRVDRDWLNSGGTVSGGGVFSSPTTPDSVETHPGDPLHGGYGSFEAQAGGWTLVPESSTAILTLLGSTVLLRRRRA